MESKYSKFIHAGGTVDVHPEIATYIEDLHDQIKEMQTERLADFRKIRSMARQMRHTNILCPVFGFAGVISMLLIICRV